MRRATFGRELPSRVDCPECRAALEFTLDAEAFAAEAGEAPIEIGDLKARRPTTRDLAGVIGEPDPQRAAYKLAQRCCVAPDGSSPVLTAAQLEKIQAALAEADSAADIVLDLRCEQCGFTWQAAFDTPGYLWIEIESHARKLLADIHTLALAYGWSEEQVLALGARRLPGELEGRYRVFADPAGHPFCLVFGRHNA